MRIHTSVLSGKHLSDAALLASVSDAGNVFCSSEQRGTRKASHAYEVRLTGDGSFSKRRTMDGQNYAATWGSWGIFLAYLFEIDPEMIAGPYEGISDFHRQTFGLFDDGKMYSGHQPTYDERLALTNN